MIRCLLNCSFWFPWTPPSHLSICWHWGFRKRQFSAGMGLWYPYLTGEVSSTWLVPCLTWQLMSGENISSVQFSCSVVSDSLQPHELQHSRPSCPSPTPRVYSNSYPPIQWCHPAISSSFVPFSSCPQSLPASGSFPMSQLFAWGGQSIGVSASASVLPMNTQDWSPLGWTGWISLQSKGPSRVFSNTTVQKLIIFWCSAFFTVQLSNP